MVLIKMMIQHVQKGETSMEKKVYERPTMEMISFAAEEKVASGEDNTSSFDPDWMLLE